MRMTCYESRNKTKMDKCGNVQSLALLNDSGTSFEEIANLIEAQF